MRSALFAKSILGMSVALSVAACSGKPPIPVSAPEGKWVSLFNGKDLSDWTVKIAGHELNDNYQNTFRVEDGLLKVSYEGYDQFGRQFGGLFYNKPFSHYWIRAEYRFVGSQAAGAPSWAYKDSGIQFHSQSPASMRKDQEFPVSVEFNLIGGRIMKRTTGDVCRNGTNLKIDGIALSTMCSSMSNVTLRGDDWITVLAEVQGGSRIKQIVNGNLIVEYTDLTLDEQNADAQTLLKAGADAKLSEGLISLQSNSHPVEFRKIELLPLD
jgi:Domain of Unknown Function (DUF1080)